MREGLVYLSSPKAVLDTETLHFGGQLQRRLRKRCVEISSRTGWMGQDLELGTEKKTEKFFQEHFT